jgi:hypothetical protein
VEDANTNILRKLTHNDLLAIGATQTGLFDDRAYALISDKETVLARPGLPGEGPKALVPEVVARANPRASRLTDTRHLLLPGWECSVQCVVAFY